MKYSKTLFMTRTSAFCSTASCVQTSAWRTCRDENLSSNEPTAQTETFKDTDLNSVRQTVFKQHVVLKPDELLTELQAEQTRGRAVHVTLNTTRTKHIQELRVSVVR